MIDGTVKYLGRIEGKHGEWVGIELDRPVGSNDGSYLGIQYFKCEPRHGVFIRSARLSPAEDEPYDAGSSYVFVGKETQETSELMRNENDSLFYDYSPVKQKKKEDGELPKQMNEWAQTRLLQSLSEELAAKFQKLKADFQALDEKVAELRRSSLEESETRRVESLVEGMEMANKTKEYELGNELFEEFRNIMKKYGIRIEG